MDPAVALVRLYLHANGYFTASEYPVIEADADGYRVATDLDVLAVRLPGAGRLVPRRGADSLADTIIIDPDPALAPCNDRIDLIIGEVKEGRAELNRGARDRGVLRAALRRFGAVPEEAVSGIVDELIKDGEADLPNGARVRLMAFGTWEDPYSRGGFTVVTLGHILRLIGERVEEHWDVLQLAQFKDEAMAFIMLAEKARRLENKGREKLEKKHSKDA